jgi:putative transposase
MPLAFTDGRRFRVLAVVDDFTRECLTLVPDTSISGLRVARELDAIIAVRGEPRTCVSDNGTELTSMAILAWTRSGGSTGITSPRENQPKTPSRRASSAGSATSC